MDAIINGRASLDHLPPAYREVMAQKKIEEVSSVGCMPYPLHALERTCST